MITEDQLAILMRICQQDNITICQEMEKRRYVLRGRGKKIADFLMSVGAKEIVVDSENWAIDDVAEQICTMPLMKFAFEDFIF